VQWRESKERSINKGGNAAHRKSHVDGKYSVPLVNARHTDGQTATKLHISPPPDQLYLQIDNWKL
jgi:hypothetical protein